MIDRNDLIHGDEHLLNDYEPITDINIDDICGDDFYVHANVKSKQQISIEFVRVEDEQTYIMLTHPFAWESLTKFAREILDQDKKIQLQLKEITC